MTQSVFGLQEDRLTLKETMGGVPLCITLSPDDLAVGELPPSIYVMPPRSSMVLALHKYVDNFKPYIVDFGESSPARPWLQWNGGEPLSWNLPLGVVADAAMAAGCSLPLKLTARFTAPTSVPSEICDVSFRDGLALTAVMMVKQACTIMFGESFKPITTLSTAQVSSLRNQSLVSESGSTEAYEDAVRTLLAYQRTTPIASWPIVLHMQEGKSTKSTQVKAPSEESLTLGHFLLDVFPAARAVKEAADQELFGAAEDQAPLKKLGWSALVCGVEVPLGTPLSYLVSQMIYSDLRLHVVLVRAAF